MTQKKIPNLSQDSHKNIQYQDLSLKSSAWENFTQLHKLDKGWRQKKNKKKQSI